MTTSSSARVIGIDVLRLVASFQMITGHTIDALLVDSARHGPIYERWVMARGLTAVAFLVAAGASMSLVSRHARFATKWRRRCRRALVIIAIGYVLHAPMDLVPAWLAHDEARAAEAWRAFLAIDVLQCTGASLLVLELVLARVRAPWPRAFVGVTSAVVLFALGPFIDRAPLGNALTPHGVFAPVQHALSPIGGALFPIIPWMGFPLLGMAWAELAYGRGASSPRPRAIARTMVLAAVAALAAWAMDGVDALHRSPWNVDPSLMARRFAAVLTITALVEAMGLGWPRSLPTPLATLARSTLFLYVSHLLVLYGGGVGLVRWWGRALTPAASIALALAMVTGTTLAALAWDRRLRARPAHSAA